MSEAPMFEHLLTIREVAALASVSVTTVRRAVEAKQLTAVVLGPQTRRFLPEDVEKWIRERREP